MRKRPPKGFCGVPTDPLTSERINRARDERTYDLYLDWLADYLYRPSAKMPVKAQLSLEAAWSRIISYEIEIAEWIWDHPWQNYPPDNYQPRHMDILHRVELSKILSRVPDHADRRELLDRFYQELGRDEQK